jgi:hypothetical protein
MLARQAAIAIAAAALPWARPCLTLDVGLEKKNRRTPPVYMLNPRPTHLPAHFFFDFFPVRVLGVLGQGSSKIKTPYKYFFNAHVESFFQIPKNRKPGGGSRCQFICFIAFSYPFFSVMAMGVQRHYNSPFYKEIVSKGFYKKNDQKPKPDFYDFFITCLGVSRGVEFKNTPKQTSKNHPPTHGGHRKKNAGPLKQEAMGWLN